MNSQLERLFLRPPRRDAAARALCFPYAGGTSTTFDGLSRALGPELDVCAFEPPGRQKRLSEPLARSMDELILPLLDRAAYLCDRPYVLFGHSLGAWVAFAFARALRASGYAPPRALVIAASRAPHLPPRVRVSELSDEDFCLSLRAMNGTPRELLADEDLMSFVLPRIRADFALADAYVPEPAPPLAVPFVVVGGTDDPTVRMPQLLAWQTHCAGTFQLQLLPGDHFFVQAQTRALGGLIERCLSGAPASSQGLTRAYASKELS